MSNIFFKGSVKNIVIEKGRLRKEKTKDHLMAAC